MAPASDDTDILGDPLWTAAVPLASAAARSITEDLIVRRRALSRWRSLCNSAAGGRLVQDDLVAAKASEELVPYPQARALLTRLLKDRPSESQAIERLFANHEPVLVDDLRQRETVQRLWDRLHRSMGDGHLQIAQRILADPRMDATPRLYPELEQRHRRVSIAVRRALDRGLAILRKAITEYAGQRGWPITVSERRLVIDSLITIELAEDRTTRVQATRVRSLSWTAVQPVIDSEYDRVWGRARREAARFLDEIGSFLETRRGENVRLRDIYEALQVERAGSSERLISYYRDEFSADLSVLLASAAARRFEFSAIRDPRLAFTVLLPGGSLQQYGFIRLRGD